MLLRRFFFAAVCISGILLTCCDSYSLLDSFSIEESPVPEKTAASELTLDIANTTLQQGESTLLYPGGGIEPYTWMVLKGDQFYTDNGYGSFSGTSYTADNSIGTVTIRLRDSAGTTKEGLVTVIPPAPTNIIVAPEGSKRLRITWSFANTNQIGNFILLRSKAGSTYSEIASLSNSDRQYSDIGLDDGTEYSYSMRTVAGAYLSPVTVPVSRTTD